MSIEFYYPENTNFETDGNVTLKPNKALFKIALNGICEIELTHPYDNEGRYKLIKNDGIIKAPTPYSEGQLFHIYKVKKNMLGGLTIKARHIFFDLNKSVILDNRAVNKTGQEALDIILEGTKFKGKSNVSKVNTAYFVKMNRVAAINGNIDNAFISRWGGEIFLDNYNITVNDRIGGDYGAYINYGNNMIDLGLEDNEDDIVTRGYPVAFNGRMLPEKYVDSLLLNKYREIKEDFIEMSDLKLQEDSSDGEGFKTEQELYQAMRNRMIELYNGGLDKPTVTGSTKVAALENTTKYKHVKGLVKIGLGDTISIYHEKLGIDSLSRCIGYTWNILTQKYESVDVGEFKENYFNKQTDIRNKVESILNGDGSIKANEIQGFIDATKASIKAQSSIAEKLGVRAIHCEDTDPNSPTYGSWIGGTQGVMVSNQRTLDGRDWDYTSALTAKGLVANTLYGKILAGNGVYFDLQKGEIYFNKGLIQGSNSSWNLDTGEFKSSLPDGSEVVISPTDGFYQKVGSNKREYYNLSYNAEIDMNNGTASSGTIKIMTITLPQEFKGKKFSVSVSIKRMESPVDGGGWFLTYYNSYIRNKDYVNGTFEVYATTHWHRVDSNNQITIGKITYPELIIDVTA